MKKHISKNQVIVLTLVGMIAVAGYLSVSGKGPAEALRVSEDDIFTEEEMQEWGTASGSAVSVSASGAAIGESGDSQQSASRDNAGEAVMVGSTVESDYFETAKLNREQTRDKNRETLLELVNNDNTSKEQKSTAVAEITAMTAVAEKERSAETLLEAKGYKNVVVTMIDDSVDVIVDAKNLKETDIAGIQDVVKRKMEVSAEKIVISTVGKKE